MKKKTLKSDAKRLWLWLLLAFLPVGAWAQDDMQALLYIEKTDGTVVKVPITPGYPLLQHMFVWEGEDRIPALSVTCSEAESFTIRQSEVKRIYTGFEATGIVVRKAETDHLIEKVYSLDGRFVGNDSKHLEGQPKGVYIVKKGEKYIKIVRP